MDKFFEKLGATVLFLTLLVGICVVFGWLTMICWNETMPYLFNLKTISYTQGIALNVLATLLIKSTANNN